MTRFAMFVAGAALVGCSSSSGSSAGGAVPGDDGGPSDASGVDAGSSAATISGAVKGARFDAASSTYVIRGADDPANLVLYVFSAKVDCSAIQAAGWDVKLASGTQFLEIKMKTATPAKYTVVPGPSLGAGEATANHSILTAGNPNEQIASGGSVTLATYVMGTHARGLFQVTFNIGSLDGTFDAPFCAGGTEP